MENQLNSLDPRIKRLGLSTTEENLIADDNAQLATFEVFQQVKAGKPFEHVGIVHASDPDLAWVFGKEQFSRRGGTCEGMFVVPSSAFTVSEYLEGKSSLLDQYKTEQQEVGDSTNPFAVFYLKKRGKHHNYIGRVLAQDAVNAMHVAAIDFYAPLCINIWVCPASAVYAPEEMELDIWGTLPEKVYRDAIAYRSQDKIDRYKATLL